jgi:hypothetical protein
MTVYYQIVSGRCRNSGHARSIVAGLLLLIAYAAAEPLAIAQAPANATAPPAAEASSTASSTAAEESGTTAKHVLLYGTGSYGTLVNLFFMLSALFTDILLIRVWLVLAYVFLAVNVLLNFPDVTTWDSNSSPQKLILGTLLWTVITLALQVSCKEQHNK